ncbi:MAG TPA: malto-oligosyltrehalose trehalohydrolase [Dehalococcoidia bacterium]|nr:malto-oligosyltrehalose trehalohydrolase [Dehalococcoidia bacterium]
MEEQHWRLEMGANVTPEGVRFRVWAPHAEAVDVEIGNVYEPLAREPDGVWCASVASASAGTRYRFRLDGAASFPDPYSRSQPDGPHGPSEVVDPRAFAWTDAGWPGLRADGLVVYELHVGTYTPAGTFEALVGELDRLRELGVNAIELMPIAEFPGARNWGYDGVDLFAPTRNYGGPDGLRRLVDAAHARGIGVILDVVYNHFGPDGNYLLQYAREYLTDRHQTPWGDAVNYDGPRSAHVRRLVIDNACYWINEFHIDGLRLDATFAMFDSSPRHILEEIATSARGSTSRDIVLIAETHENDARYVRPASDGGYGFDAVWSDDFHHCVHTAASHEHAGYYADYAGTLDELARTIARGWLFEGQASSHLGHARGTPAAGLPASGFVYFIQNHDQVGNRAFGRRFSHLVGAEQHKFWSALLLLLPYTPLLFMGQEFAASSRFYYFTDHNEELGRQVTEGRRKEFASFAAFADPKGQREIPDPQAEQTFLDSKLDLRERDEGIGAQTWALYRELLRARREDPVLRRQDRARMEVTAAGERLLLVRLWHGGDERLIAANCGVGIDATPEAAGVPRALRRGGWRKLISSEERRFGGSEDHVRFDAGLISLPPYAVVLLARRRPPLPFRTAAGVRSLASGLIGSLRRRRA